MGYKLNDFTNINKPGFAAELDEQIRLLCDVLYNQREIYPGQLGGRTSAFPSHHFDVYRPTGATRPLAGLTSFLGAAARTSPAAATDQSTADEEFTQVRSAIGSVGSFVGNTTFPYSVAAASSQTFDCQPYFKTRVKINTLTDMEVVIALGTVPAGIITANWPWTAALNVGGIAFDYRSANGSTWFVVSKNGAGTTKTNTFNTSIPVVTDQIYTLEFVAIGTGSSQRMYCYIDGVLVATIAQTDYALGTIAVNWYLYLAQSAAGDKQLATSLVMTARRPAISISTEPFAQWLRGS